MRARPFAVMLALSCAPASGGGDGSSSGGGSSSTSTGTTTVGTASTSSTTSAESSGEASSGSSGDATDSGSTGEPAPSHVMIYATSGTRVHGWRMEVDGGALADEVELDLGGELGPLAHAADATRLWVGQWDDEKVVTLAIDPVSGALTELGDAPVGGDMVYLSLDRPGTHLLLADFNGGEVVSHALAADGTLEATRVDAIAVGGNPHSIVLAPAGDHAFAPNLPLGVVHQLVYDEETGTLESNMPAQVTAPADAGPRHMVFSADARFAWVINEMGDSITRWRYDAAAGLLSDAITVDTLPDGVDGSDNYCADLHLGPGDAFLYGSNRGHDTLAIFAVDPDDGTLTWLGEVATEAQPRSFAVEPGRRFLYAAGRDSGRLASYTIADDGTLVPLEVVDVQPQPVWVEAVALPP